MFLADLMRLATESPSLGRKVDGRPLPLNGQAYFRWQAERILDSFDLYAFTASALAVSADLRIDSPDRFEGIAEAVFSRPRRVFIEANSAERLARLRTMRGFPKMVPRPEHRHEPDRVGLAIEVIEPGKAVIDVVWCFGRASIKSLARDLDTASTGQSPRWFLACWARSRPDGPVAASSPCRRVHGPLTASAGHLSPFPDPSHGTRRSRSDIHPRPDRPCQPFQRAALGLLRRRTGSRSPSQPL